MASVARSTDGDAVVKTIGLASAALFTGYTWALSDASVPSVLLAKNEKVMLAEWRRSYLQGFYVSRPLCAISGLSFGYLAYSAPSSSLVRALYAIAAVATSSGVPYALTFLRATNGALAARAERLAGPEGDTPPLTYAVDDERAKERDAAWSTRDQIRRWQWHNTVRAVILGMGTVVGGIAIAL